MSFAANGNPDGTGGRRGLGRRFEQPGFACRNGGATGALTGMPGAGLLGGAASAVQLAQTGLSLIGKAPESIAEAINGLTGAVPRLTQDNRFVTIETPLGPDVLLVSAAVIDEHVNQLTETHLDLLSHRNNIG